MAKKTVILFLVASIVVISLYMNFHRKTLSIENLPELSGNEVLVLAYHRIRNQNLLLDVFDTITFAFSEDRDNEMKYYSIYTEEFLKQIKYLKEKGAHFITPQELEDYLRRNKKLPEKSVLITFDDTDISVYKNAFPILKKENIPFTIFVITGEVGNPNFKGLHLCSWDEIKDMMSSGLVTVGSHSHKMHYLTKKENPPFFDEQKIGMFAEDIRQSIQAIHDELGCTPKYFSYPYGFGTPKTDQAALDSGMKLLFTLAPGVVKPSDPSFFVKRVLVTRSNWSVIARWIDNYRIIDLVSQR